jgi:inosine-uridine nucleoside N-ribohydrolase
VPEIFTLDTDIGSDVDDILALVMALGSPELDLAAVTTVYGDTRLRAQIVARTLRIAGAGRIPVVPGLAATRSGRDVWWAGHEGRLMPDLETEEVNAGDAVGLLASQQEIVAIAPLTNVAAALEREASQIGRIYLMGGEFRAGSAEHNIKCDLDAAAAVFASDVPVVVTGLDQTERTRIGAPGLSAIAASGPLGQLIATEMTQFWSFTGNDFNVPHDPLAILTIARPDLFEFERGRVTVVTSGHKLGATLFEPDPEGPHRIVCDYDPTLAAEEIISRILAATTHAARQLNEERTYIEQTLP